MSNWGAHAIKNELGYSEFRGYSEFINKTEEEKLNSFKNDLADFILQCLDMPINSDS